MTVRFGKKSWMGALATSALLLGTQSVAWSQEAAPGSDALFGAAIAVQEEDGDEGDDEGETSEAQEHELKLRAEIELLRAKLAEHEQALRGMTLRRQVDRAATQRELAERAMEEARLAERVHGMLLNGQVAGRYWLGVQTMPLSELAEEVRVELKAEEGAHGLVVDSVVDDSPAEEAGLQKLDIIVKANGEPVEDVVELITIVTESEAQPIKLDVVRSGEAVEVTVTPAERPAGFAIPVEGLRIDANELMHIDADDMAEHMRMRLFVPDATGQMADIAVDGGMSMQINREGDKPAEIKIQYRGETYEGTEDSIDMFPEEIREQVRRAVEGMQGEGNFRIMMMQNGEGNVEGGLLRLAPLDALTLEGFKLALPEEVRREILLGRAVDGFPIPADGEGAAAAGSAELERMRAEMAEIKALLKKLLEERE